MKPDFDPYDLTPRITPEQEPAAAPPPKPTIRRVTMGPIFHSRITKILALVLGAVLAALIGYVSVDYYYAKKNVAPIKTTSSQSNTSAQSNTTNSSTVATAPATEKVNSPSTAEQKAILNTPGSCDAAVIPAAVCVLLLSIEKDGLKNNPYVIADTSKVPEGSSVVIDKTTWKKTSETTGTINFSTVMAGKSYKGTASVQFISDSWKAISYTLT